MSGSNMPQNADPRLQMFMNAARNSLTSKKGTGRRKSDHDGDEPKGPKARKGHPFFAKNDHDGDE